ncbi:hypothetical protein KRX54_04970 [Actinomycetaceae bacterium TAE3-ERU4]|nr:hypothetical protein [Actinomycetaceae bacterium TAE3-ERU4]
MDKITLIVGGTGMLLECSRILAKQSSLCLLPNRHPDIFSKLGGSVNSFYGNWEKEIDFFQVCSKKLKDKKIDLLIWWCHRPYSQRLAPLMTSLLAPNAKVVEVIGSSNLDDLSKVEKRRLFPGSYLAVLGRGENGWLTHKEISQGVLEIVESQQSKLIGRL